MLLLFIVFNLTIGLGNLRDLHLLFVVDLEVLSLQQVKVFLQLLFTLLSFLDLSVKIVDLSNQSMVLDKLFFLFFTLLLYLISALLNLFHEFIVGANSVT